MAKMSTTKLSPWPCPLLISVYFSSCGDSYYRTVNNTNPTRIGLETIGWTDGPTDFLLWSIFLQPIVYYLLVIFLLSPNDDRTLKIMMVRVRVFSSLNLRRYMYLISCNNLFQVIVILCIFLTSFANITWLTLGTILITLALTNVKTGPIIEFFSKDKQPMITCIV